MNDNARIAHGTLAAPLQMQDASNPRSTVASTAVWLASNSAGLKARLLPHLRAHPQVAVLGDCDADDASLSAQLAERRPDLLLIDWLGTARPGRAPSVMKDYAALAPRVLLLVEKPTASVIEGILKHRLHGYLRFDSSIEPTYRACGTRASSPSIPTSSAPSSSSALESRRSCRGGSPGFRHRCSSIFFTMRGCATNTLTWRIRRLCFGAADAAERGWMP